MMTTDCDYSVFRLGILSGVSGLCDQNGIHFSESNRNIHPVSNMSVHINGFEPFSLSIQD
jgi:hypothetical protein